MKRKFALGLGSLLLIGNAFADSLYYVGSEAQESLPLKWVVGLDASYDDNVVPGGSLDGEESFSVNPYVGLSFVSITPQTTWDVYARLGVIYYFDEPENGDDVYGQARTGINLTHRFDERLRFSSRNFIAYELEPDYSYGFASNRQAGEYLFWQTDNSIGYRWSERFATYTGFELSGLHYDDVDNQDRFTWTVYNQFRYQLTPQTVLTGDYRYSRTNASDDASDSDDHYLLVGVEHRISPTTIVIARAGAQIHDVDGGENSTSPYVELAVNSQVNTQFSIRGFLRYGIEYYDTVQVLDDGNLYVFDEKKTLRLGVSGNYAISPTFSLFGGVDYIPSWFDEGRQVGGPLTASSQDENLVNAYIGVALKLTDSVTASLTYNRTDSDSDLVGRDYDRNRITVGVRAEF